MLGINRMKSAGITVSKPVYEAIGQGNRARDACDWSKAIAAYQTALALQPDLYHIWIQMGHSAKEGGYIEEAQTAYAEANRLRPQGGEARLLLAHLHKNNGHPRMAVCAFMALAAMDAHRDEALRELVALVSPVAALTSDRIRAVLDRAGQLPAPDLATTVAALDDVLAKLPDGGGDAGTITAARALIARIERGEGLDPCAGVRTGDRTLVFDISDLVAHFRHHRLPTGIQRVQIEMLAAALKAQGADGIGICCFIDGRDYWIEIPVERFLALAYLSSGGSESDWQVARDSLFFHLAIDKAYDLPERAILINLGTSWWIYDYFRLIREARAAKGIAYIPMVYDLIPILAPQYCVAGITGDYVSWAVGVFQHADGYLAISESTKRDLITVAGHLGHAVPPEKVQVIALDADFRRMAAAPLPLTTLRRWQLEDVPYALFVSTIEARKNHNLAFDAWAELIRIHGRERLPRLVCVGRNGWLNDQAFARLAANDDLRAHVTIIHQASDEELALLYGACRFTVYPSHYEGWGLPVTESLCYGRVPVVADNSSLPEAGGDFALMFEPDSVEALVKAVETVAFDDAWRLARQARIAAEFCPRRWSDLYRQSAEAVRRFAVEHPVDIPAMRAVSFGTYYPTALYRDRRIWRSLASGEIFRAGEGWLWPETDGCRTTPAGGDLCMTLPEAGQPLRLYLHLRGLSEAPCPFSIIAGGETILSGMLRAGERRWVMADLPAPGSPEVAVTVKGEAAERIGMATGGTMKSLLSSLTVLGFALCCRDDEEARIRFVEALALGDVDDVNAYRQPAAVTAW